MADAEDVQTTASPGEGQAAMSDDLAAVEALHDAYGKIAEQLAHVIVGQSEVIEQVMMDVMFELPTEKRLTDYVIDLDVIERGWAAIEERAEKAAKKKPRKVKVEPPAAAKPEPLTNGDPERKTA